MTNILTRLFGRARKGSGATAKDRLRFVLQHDRINLPPERMEEMKREILAVIVKYLVVDKDRVEIDLEQRDRTHSKLIADIPVAINMPKSAQRMAEDAVAAAETAEPNGANNGAEAIAAKADEVIETEENGSPDDVKSGKADECAKAATEDDAKPQST